jgi:hypothetical protein
MTEPKKEAPAAANSQSDNTISRPHVVSDNPNPRQRWRGNPPLKPVAMSAEMAADIAAMAMGGRNDGR